MSVNIKTNSNSKTLAETSNISNPNLLINTNFADTIIRYNSLPISSNIRKYDINRWYSTGNFTISQEDGYMRLTMLKNEGALLMAQWIEMPENTVPDIMTISLRCRAGQKSKYHLYNTDRYYIIGTEWQTLEITFTKEEMMLNGDENIKNNCIRAWIGCKSYNYDRVNNNNYNMQKGDYFDIQWVKLEVGNHATQYIAPNKAEELIKCKRYYMILYGWQSTYPMHGDNINQYIAVSQQKMRVAPTFSTNAAMYMLGLNNDKSATFIQSANITSTNIDEGTTVICNTNINLNAGVATPTCNMELDAEIY